LRLSQPSVSHLFDDSDNDIDRVNRVHCTILSFARGDVCQRVRRRTSGAATPLLTDGKERNGNGKETSALQRLIISSTIPDVSDRKK